MDPEKTAIIITGFQPPKIYWATQLRTAGAWPSFAAAFFPPWYFELPNSHVMFKLEIEMAFNPDGTINEIYGTRPDFELETSTYPTSYPESSEKEDLLNDQWIQWVLKR